jgi:hypothetical protein
LLERLNNNENSHTLDRGLHRRISRPRPALSRTKGEVSCSGEAFRACWRAMPDRHSVFLCLLDNRSILNETMKREARLRMHHGVMDRSSRRQQG